jgi:uncharacterized membrane protein
VNNIYLFIGLFALDFLLVGIVSTKTIKPELTLKEVLRNVKYILPLGLLFSLISSGIVYFMKMTATNILIILSIITILISLIAIIRTQDRKKKNENPEEYSEKSILRIIYLLILFCIISYIGIEVPPFSVIPLWFGLCIPFILILPGYLALNIVNPYKDDIRTVERLGISVFISLIITSIIGLILVQIEHLLNMRHVSLVLVVATLIIFLPLYYIRIKEKKTFVLFNDKRLNRIFILMTIIGLIAVVASGVLVSTGNLPNGNNTDTNIDPFVQGNTSFEVTGIHETPDDDGYYSFENGDNLNLSINITNQEHKDMQYTLKIEIINDTANSTFSEENITLKDNQNQIIDQNITMRTGKKDIKFTLFNDNNQPYKIRHLYVDVKEEEY